MDENSAFVPANDVLSADVADELVVMRVESGRYYGLNATAALLWRALPQAAPISLLAEALAERTGLEQERALADVTALLAALREEGLIVAVQVKAHRLELPALTHAYLPPALQYGELKDVASGNSGALDGGTTTGGTPGGLS